MRRTQFVLAVLVTASTLVLAAQGLDVTKIPGSWKPYPTRDAAMPYDAPAWLTPAQAQAMRANLDAIKEVFHRTPVMAKALGFTVFPKRQLIFDQRGWPRPTQRDRRWPIQGHLALWGSVFEPDGKTVYEDTGSAFILHASANDLACVFNNASEWAHDGLGTMYLEPEPPTEKMHGFPAYRYCVLITHRTAPFYVPVSQERVLGVRIADADANVAGWKALGGELYATWQRIAASLRAQLAALDATARKAPAYVTDPVNQFEPLVSAGVGRAVVEANPAFFDATRPTDVQVLTMFEGCVTDSCAETEIVLTLRIQLDWPALAAIVK